MISADGTTTTRAVSRDGTAIAYQTTGVGPPVVLVHGMAGDHTRWRPLLPFLEPHATVHAMDRRGHGASGDAPGYAVEREYEDVAAVVDAVADASGSGVDVLGHSFGGLCAFGAATMTPNIRRLALYEGFPPPDPAAFAWPPGVPDRIDALLAAGDREAALETFLREVVELSAPLIEDYRRRPEWPTRVAVAHTLLREGEAERGAPLDPAMAAEITAPTLLLLGGDSPDRVRDATAAVASALPDARVTVIEGQAHLASALAPAQFARHLLAFLRDQPA